MPHRPSQVGTRTKLGRSRLGGPAGAAFEVEPWHVQRGWRIKSGHPASSHQIGDGDFECNVVGKRQRDDIRSSEYRLTGVVGRIGRDKSQNRKRHSHLVETVHQSNRFSNSPWRFHVVSRPFRTSAGEKTLIPVKRAKSGVLNVTRVVTRCRCMAATNRAS